MQEGHRGRRRSRQHARAAFGGKSMWLPGLVLIVHALTSTPVSAQVNIERLRASDIDAGWSFETRLELASRTGNVDITTLGVDIRTDVVGAGHHTFVLGRGSFGWKDGATFSNEGLAHLRHTHFRQARISVEAFAQLDYDKSRLLDLRGIAGIPPSR